MKNEHEGRDNTGTEKKVITLDFSKLKMPKFIKNENFYVPFFITLVIYGIIGSVTVCGGLMDADSKYNQDCQKIARIDYIFPGHQLGCWLGKDL